MEDKIQNEKAKKILSEIQNSMKALRIVNGLKEKPTIPYYQINKKIQKKLLKDHSKKNKNNSENTKTYNKKPKQSNN